MNIAWIVTDVSVQDPTLDLHEYRRLAWNAFQSQTPSNRRSQYDYVSELEEGQTVEEANHAITQLVAELNPPDEVK